MGNKVALVTGSGKGIGKGIAIALAKAGYDVAVNYFQSRKQAEDTAETIEQCGQKAILLQADVRSSDDLGRMFEQFSQQFDHIDLLVNNSGVTKMSPFLETTPELFEEVVGTNFKGVYFTAQAAARLMVEKGTRGTIINISSNHALGCWPDSTVYAAVKAGINKLTMNMALDLSEYGIRVVGIAPGYTQLEYHTDEMKEQFQLKTAVKIPLGRFLTCEEVGEACIYLASEKAAYITGTTLSMDGGAVLPVVADHRF